MNFFSRHFLAWVLSASLIVTIAGCGSESQAPTVPEVPEVTEIPEVPEVPEGGYSIGVAATPSGSNVEFVVQTNIPGTIEVMAGVDLKGQASDDVYIGASERIRIVDGAGTLTLDASELPAGDYLAEVSFYPRWGFQDELSRSTGISQDLSDSHDISLGGTGESAADMQVRENSQKWVMGNVVSGYAWNESEWIERFGDYEDLPVEGLNPRVISAYYFPKLDMTIFVNTLKGSISHWRVGKASR